jgi:hypothetical protein
MLSSPLFPKPRNNRNVQTPEVIELTTQIGESAAHEMEVMAARRAAVAKTFFAHWASRPAQGPRLGWPIP